MNDTANILLVEDSDTQAALTTEILERENYGVFRAENAQKALELLKRREFSVILSDVEMPGLNGYEFCRKVKDDPATKGTPFILLTVLSDPGDIITGLECGADNFVTKPFEPDYLLSWIKHHIVNRELRKDRGAQAGLEFYFSGHKHFLASDRMQILDILLSTYEAAVKKNRELRAAQRDLERLNDSLESRVEERTAELRREVEARVKAEADLRGARQREDMVLHTLPVAFFTAKPEKGGLHVDWVSSGVEKVCGFKPSEVLQKPDILTSRIHPDDQARAMTDIARLWEEGSLSAEYRCRAAGDEYHWVLLTATRTDGGALGLVLDISEKKTLESQLRQAQKMEAIGRLAGGVAHDFNNLLTAIDGYAGFLLRGLAPDDERRADVAEIRKAANAAAALTRQLLAFSRRQIFQTRVLDCNDVIRSTQNMLKRLIGENIALALDLSREECRIKADQGQLEQIILNLVVNSRDAMPDGGKITVKTENMELSEKYCKMHMEVRPGAYVMLQVSDTGRGMPPDVLSHIFEPFFTTKEAAKGTGLGLATVYGIVKQSGGNIYVYSEPGLGTTFKIYLPRVAESVSPAPAAPRPMELHGSETLLLVEDDDGVRGFGLRALRENGYTALEARNAEEAERICKENADRIRLVLTDTVMPGKNGHELRKAILESCPAVKFILMSGYTDTELANSLLTVDKVPFLQKPVSAEDLLRKVREVLDAPEAVRT